MKTLWQLKQEIDSRLDTVKRGAKFKKAEWIEFLEELSSSAEHLEDRLHDDCYSSDSIQDMVSEQIEEMERDKYSQLQKLDAEEHRKRFGVIQGGAA